MTETLPFNILNDDLTAFSGPDPVCVGLGEVMLRDTPADQERLERTRLVHLSMGGTEYSLAIALSRLGISSSFITRVPDNPFGWAVRNIAREQGVHTDHFVWAPAREPIGRYMYEIGRTPRQSRTIYQRMHSAAVRLGPGMVDWATALRGAKLLHSTGITFGLAAHSGYERNYLYEALVEASEHKPADCRVGIDSNYRSPLWSVEEARKVMTPIITDHVDILVTTVRNMAELYDLGCGPYSAAQIMAGELQDIPTEMLQEYARDLLDRFQLQTVAITMRHPDNMEVHQWEAAALSRDGRFFRSARPRSVTLLDRLGGGDTWNAGFYYGLLTENDGPSAIEKGVRVGDAATRIKQTLMFDLPIIDRDEVQALLAADFND